MMYTPPPKMFKTALPLPRPENALSLTVTPRILLPGPPRPALKQKKAAPCIPGPFPNYYPSTECQQKSLTELFFFTLISRNIKAEFWNMLWTRFWRSTKYLLQNIFLNSPNTRQLSCIPPKRQKFAFLGPNAKSYLILIFLSNDQLFTCGMSPRLPPVTLFKSMFLVFLSFYLLIILSGKVNIFVSYLFIFYPQFFFI